MSEMNVTFYTWNRIYFTTERSGGTQRTCFANLEEFVQVLSRCRARLGCT